MLSKPISKKSLKVDPEIHAAFMKMKAENPEMNNATDLLRFLMEQSPHRKGHDSQPNRRGKKRKMRNPKALQEKKRKFLIRKQGIESWDEMTQNEEIFKYMTGVTVEQGVWLLDKLEIAVSVFLSLFLELSSPLLLPLASKLQESRCKQR